MNGSRQTDTDDPAAKDILYKPNQPIHTVYFPETAVICQMTVMENGDTLETATVGTGGAPWISASIGAPSMPCETMLRLRRLRDRCQCPLCAPDGRLHRHVRAAERDPNDVARSA
jgi:hypothetical protein